MAAQQQIAPNSPWDMAIGTAPGAWGPNTPVRDGGFSPKPAQPAKPAQQQQAQPQQWGQPQGQQPKQQQMWGQQAQPRQQGQQARYNANGSYTVDIGNGQSLTFAPDGTPTLGGGMLYSDPTTQAMYNHTQDLYNQGNSTVSDFLNSLNGGGRGGAGGGGVMPNMGGILPQGLPDPNAAGGTGSSGMPGYPGWNAPAFDYQGLGSDYQNPDILGQLGLGNLGLGDVGQYGGSDNTVGLALSAMLMGQVPAPGNEMLPTPGQRSYESGITGGQMDPAQLEAIRQPLTGGLSMPSIPGMTGGEMGQLGGIFNSAGGSALANQRNAYDLMAADKGNTLNNNRMQAQADAGLAGQQFGINRELQDLRRYNTNANQDNSLQQSAIQMLMSALGGF